METEKEISDKEVKKMKDALEKDHGREFTWEEATRAIWDLKQLAHIMFEIGSEQFRREKLLKENPKGFHLDKTGYCCLLCGGSASGENSWVDKYGLKCMTCQKAVNDKTIPGSVTNNKESWYSKMDLESYFNIKGADLNKYIKQALLKDRVIKGEGKRVHLQLFLLKDNKDVLPPKKFLKSRTVKVMHKGEEYFTQESWYEFADEKLIKRLAKYKILYCLPEMLSKPIDSGRLLHKQPNPLFTMK
jgi:hypothetical protein